MMSTDGQITSTEYPEAMFNDFLAYTELLNTPSLARLYSFILRTELVTIDTIKAELGMAHSTTYKYIGRLEEMGIPTRHEDGATTVSVEPLHPDQDTDHGEVAATPVLVAAIGRQIDTEDTQIFTERQGIAKLAAALHYTLRIMNGELTQWTAANKLGVPPIEGITVFTAHQDVIEEAAAYDPYLEQP